MEKVLKIVFIEIFSKQKILNEKKLRPPAALYMPYAAWIGIQPN